VPVEDQIFSDDRSPEIQWTYHGPDDAVKFRLTVIDDKGHTDHKHTLPYGVCTGGTCAYTLPTLKNDAYSVKLSLINRLGVKRSDIDFTIAVPAR
jgi:hypothetical protein